MGEERWGTSFEHALLNSLDPSLGFIGDTDQFLATRSYVASFEHA
jgi:hypothetical protein